MWAGGVGSNWLTPTEYLLYAGTMTGVQEI